MPLSNLRGGFVALEAGGTQKNDRKEFYLKNFKILCY